MNEKKKKKKERHRVSFLNSVKSGKYTKRPSMMMGVPGHTPSY